MAVSERQSQKVDEIAYTVAIICSTDCWMKYKLTLLTYFKARAHISTLWEKTDKELKFHKAVTKSLQHLVFPGGLPSKY